MTSIRSFSTKLLRQFISNRSYACVRHSKYSTQCEPQQIQTDTTNQLLNPLNHPDFFYVHNLFTVQQLFYARVHYGHKEGSLHENMLPFIFGSRFGHLIIDLDQTAVLLRQALNFAAHIAFKEGIILFIAKNPDITYIVDKTAKECSEFSYTRPWIGSTLLDSTNQFGTLIRLPDLCILINSLDDVTAEHPAVIECAKMCIPTIGIVDTNCNPNLITYPVPGNDDSHSAIKLYCKLFKEAILRGKQARKTIVGESAASDDNKKTV